MTNGTPGSSGAYTRITVAADAPLLYYYCTNHSGMGSYVEIGSWYGKEVVTSDSLIPHTLFVWGGNGNGALGQNNTTPDFTTVGGIQIPGTTWAQFCLLYTSPSPRDATLSRMPSSA